MEFLSVEEVKNLLKYESLSEDIRNLLDKILQEYKFFIKKSSVYFISYEYYKKYVGYVQCSLDYIKSVDSNTIWKIKYNNGIEIKGYKVCIIKIENNVYFEYITGFKELYIANDNKIYLSCERYSNFLKFLLESVSSFYKYCNLSAELKRYIINKFFIKNEYLEKDLKEEDYILLDKKIENYYNFKTKKQLLGYIFKENINLKLNKIPFYLGYSLMKLKKYLLQKDFENLYKFCLKYKNNTYNLVKINRNGYLYNIIEAYYIKEKKFDSIKTNRYINDIFYLKTLKICISKKSYKKLCEEIDHINALCILKKDKKKLIIPKEVLRLKLPYNFKLIKKSKDLYNEAILQNNCLWEHYYPDLKVPNNKKAIFSTNINNLRYTLALKVDREKYIEIEDLRGVNNSIPPDYLLEEIKKTVSEFNLKAKNKK